jgi:hypothetical protein
MRLPLGVAFLQLDEIGEDMDAVDATIRPEIEHHNFAGELFAERERRGVKPILALGKIRRLERFRPLVYPLDVCPELLEQFRETLAARRQVGRLAKRLEQSANKQGNGQLGQA